MDTLQPRQISVLEPVGAAIEKTKEILFRPFDLGKWFTLGFCAWLATLGEDGRSFIFRGWGYGDGTCGQPRNFGQGLENFIDGLMENLFIIIPVIVIILLLFLFLVMVLIWLNSRGQFMFLHCVSRNVTEVKIPWKRYAAEGDSLYRFKLILWFASMAFGVLIAVPIVLLIIPMANTNFEVLMFAPITGIVFLVLLAIIVGIAFGIISTLTKDFVVPIMYLQSCTVTEGWKRFWNLCRRHKSNFVLYVLFLFVVTIVIGMLVLLVILFTCCCAACIFMIPYIGTVALLPVLVWRRAYSALFLAQFGPEFDVFPKPQTVVVPSDLIPPAPPTQSF